MLVPLICRHQHSPSIPSKVPSAARLITRSSKTTPVGGMPP